MKYLEAVGSYTIAVVLALIVTYVLPGDGSSPTMIEAILTMMSLGTFSLGVFQTVKVLWADYEKGIF